MTGALLATTTSPSAGRATVIRTGRGETSAEDSPVWAHSPTSPKESVNVKSLEPVLVKPGKIAQVFILKEGSFVSLNPSINDRRLILLGANTVNLALQFYSTVSTQLRCNK